MADGLTCQQLVELVTEYLEEALPPAERQAFETHLGGCSGCQGYLAQMRQTIALTGQLTPSTLQPDAKEELLQLFRNWKKK
jgi:anti-sigma factor RsiW